LEVGVERFGGDHPETDEAIRPKNLAGWNKAVTKSLGCVGADNEEMNDREESPALS
jgi:hypothetical protein